MNFALAITLALAAAVEGRLASPQVSFAEQVSFLAEPCADRGCAPDYCYPMYEPEDKQCYKSGYPKCCTKNKGNCPNGSKPGCECSPGTCSNSDSTRSERCMVGDGTCKGATYCQVAEGTCGGEGRCEDMPAQCDRTLKQVCGCNGETYDNECLAHAHGVSVDYEGGCGSQPAEGADCTLDGPDGQCGSEMFCAADAGQCNLRMAGIPGTCRPYRDACTMSYAPVCGCDLETYDNADCAQAAGANVAHEGACNANDHTSCTYTGVDNDDCSLADSFCRLQDGDCNARVANMPGYCGLKPKGCSYILDPVCGCDMRTYDNECQARAAGVNVAKTGRC